MPVLPQFGISVCIMRGREEEREEEREKGEGRGKGGKGEVIHIMATSASFENSPKNDEI